MKLIKFKAPDESGHVTPSLTDGGSWVKFTKSPFSFFLAGQESYMLLGYWEIVKNSRTYSLTTDMYNMWLNCDEGIAFWDDETQQLHELELSTASDMKFFTVPRNATSPSFNVLYQVKINGYHRPIIVNSGWDELQTLLTYLRDQSQGKSMTFIRLELAQWNRFRPKILDSSNNSLEYVLRGTGNSGPYEIPWAIPAGEQKTAILQVNTDGSQIGGSATIAYGEDKEIANYMAHRPNDSNKVGKITPAFTGYGYSLFIVDADPSAEPRKISLDNLYYELVANFSADENDALGNDDGFIAA